MSALEAFLGGLFSVSYSSAESRQRAISNIFQSYQGNCNISCDNEISNINITAINTDIKGNIEVTQSCAVDGNCTFNSSANTLSDVLFKASNSASAKAGAAVAGVNVSSTDSKTDIEQNISQSVIQKCDISSTNQINDVTVFAANSNIGGNIEISQTGKAGGGCALNSTMTAATYATVLTDNKAHT